MVTSRAFMHPITGKAVEIEAPLPRDISDLIALAGLEITESTERTDQHGETE